MYDLFKTKELLELLKQVKWSDAKKLHILNKVVSWRVYERHEATERRRKFIDDIHNLAEDGMIAVVQGGRDCDGEQWEGLVSLVPATKQAVEGHIQHNFEWADGPLWHHLERPSVAKGIPYSSRDLALEAFEDGHPHVLRP